MLGAEEEFQTTACEISNLDGAIALQQFRQLCQNSLDRRRNANAILLALGTIANYNISDFSQDGMLVKLVLVLPPKGPTADEVITVLADAGVECQKGYVPLHQKMKGETRLLPTSEALWNRVVCIPVDTALKNPKRLFRLSSTWPGYGMRQDCAKEDPLLRDSRIGEHVG
jgi:dTDP-4-amino-4,6-dideoxygalactose transaminase